MSSITEVKELNPRGSISDANKEVTVEITIEFLELLGVDVNNLIDKLYLLKKRDGIIINGFEYIPERGSFWVKGPDISYIDDLDNPTYPYPKQ